jgi:alkanesulfonate monooxygenase SsuD/methylene tetrahydromethanopterin reductase-like flavin-dependent oxidoreductase (luciferase family)
MDRGIGVMGAIKPPEEALDGLDSAQRTQFDQLCQRGLVGNPEQVYTKLNTLSQDLGVSECAVITWTHDFVARLDSYELLARQHHTQAALKKNLPETDAQTISS